MSRDVACSVFVAFRKTPVLTIEQLAGAAYIKRNQATEWMKILEHWQLVKKDGFGRASSGRRPVAYRWIA